jgi:DNA-binding Lrp family transcriptional regulator
LRKELPGDFSPERIDPRLYSAGEVTPLGLWRIDSRNAKLLAIDQTIREIQRRFDEDPPPARITAAEIAQAIKLTEEAVGEALYSMEGLGYFFTTAAPLADRPRAWSYIDLTDMNAYDEYLRYEGLGELLQRVYDSLGAELASSLTYSVLHPAIINTQTNPAELALREERRNSAFVIMAMDPGNPELLDVYRTIQSVCQEFGVQALRIDDIEHSETITSRILAEIEACSYVIADLTGERPNVYYEIGYAHGLKKSPILFRKADTRLHFDLSVHKAPEFKNQTQLSELLRKRLKALVPGPR